MLTFSPRNGLILVAALLLLSLSSRAQSPSIEFTSVPPWGDTLGLPLQGIVRNADSSSFQVATYLYAEFANGWWVKPLASQPRTNFRHDGSWSTNVNTGLNDKYATRFLSLVVRRDSTVPLCMSGCPVLDTALLRLPYAIVCRPPGSKRILFAGFTWVVKKADSTRGTVGPDSNYFTDRPEDVFADNAGLHLSITRIGTKWFCTEVIADTVLGYGTYRFEIASRVDNIDSNAVLGLFTWDDCAPFSRTNPNSAYREIDMEFSRWGTGSNPYNAQYVVQPDTLNRHRFRVPDSLYSVHSFRWDSASVLFTSAYGISGSETHSWEYSTHAVIPRKGAENPRINFWLLKGRSLSVQRTTIVIKRFTFSPIINTVAPINSGIPTGFALLQNYPNPFNPETRIKFQISFSNDVSLKVFDVLGRGVKTLVNERLQPGSYETAFDGNGLASGVYLYRLQAGGVVETKKLLLLR